MFIFKFFKINKMIREAKENPSAFAGDEARGAVIEIFVIPIITSIIFCILFFVLGYTSLVIRPYLFFKILFIFSVFGLIALILTMRFVAKVVQNIARSAVKKQNIIKM